MTFAFPCFELRQAAILLAWRHPRLPPFAKKKPRRMGHPAEWGHPIAWATLIAWATPTVHMRPTADSYSFVWLDNRNQPKKWTTNFSVLADDIDFKRPFPSASSGSGFGRRLHLSSSGSRLPKRLNFDYIAITKARTGEFTPKFGLAPRKFGPFNDRCSAYRVPETAAVRASYPGAQIAIQRIGLLFKMGHKKLKRPL